MSGSQADARLIAPDLLDLRVAADGSASLLSTAGAELGTFAGCTFGVWEAGPGAERDVEADELFVVLSGRGSVELEDGSTIELWPGTLVRLHEGDRTTWTITERLRKLYISGPERR